MKDLCPPDKKKIIQRVAAWYLIALFFFGWGFGVAQYKLFADGATKTPGDRIKYDHQERPSDFDFTGFRRRDQAFTDSGYLLTSGYDKDRGQTVVKLFSIETQAILHTWVPRLSEIFRLSPSQRGGINTKMGFRSQHPLLLRDGSVVLTSGEGPLVRIDPCGNPVWVLDRHFHHSIEQDDQSNFVVPVMIKPPIVKAKCTLQDNGFAVVSPDGLILKEYSVTDILTKNGYGWLVYGIGAFEKDRLHLNDAQPILVPSGTTETGDIALSMRNLCAVALFRPSTGNIVWLKTGPWISQHDITPTDGGGFSVFGNDVPRCAGSDQDLTDKNSDVYVYDPVENTNTQPFTEIMKKEHIVTPGGGRARILSNGDAFIEETDRSRILRISRENVRWEYVNSVSPETVGAIHWARYIPPDEINLEWKEHLRCSQD
jgi:hypothetical protein